MKKLILLVLLAIVAVIANADPQWYSDVYGTTNYNGQVTLKDASGNSVTMPSNPTGSNVSATQSASVQLPVVVVQATATLPIKTAGSACTATTGGTSPNQTADEGTAITADRTMLLTCQFGVWKNQSLSTRIISSSGYDSAVISCNSTELLVGGGCKSNGGTVSASRPFPDISSWQCQGLGVVWVDAICLTK